MMERFCTYCGSAFEQGVGACPSCGKERAVGPSSAHLDQVLHGAATVVKGLAKGFLHCLKVVWQDAVSIARVSSRVMSADPEHPSRLRSFSSKTRSIWAQLTRRETMLLLATPVVLATTVALVQLKNDAQQSTDRAQAESPHVKAGGYLCNQSWAVQGNRALRNHPWAPPFRGCERVGARIDVSILREDPNFGAVLVGNSGGTAWVDRQDLAQ